MLGLSLALSPSGVVIGPSVSSLLASTAPYVPFGNSLLQHDGLGNNTAGSEEFSYHSRGHRSWLKLAGCGGKYINWWTTDNSPKFFKGHNEGISGNQLSQMVSRRAGVYAKAIGGCIDEDGGTNDVNALVAQATIVNQKIQLHQEAIAAGVSKYIMRTIPFRNQSGATSWAVGSAQHTLCKAVNVDIRAYCAGRTDVVLFDIAAATTQGDADWTPVAGTLDTADSTHNTPYGAWLAVNHPVYGLKQIVDAIFARASAPDRSGTNYYPNPTLSGSSAAQLATNMTGFLATSIRAQRSGGTSAAIDCQKGVLASSRADAPVGETSQIITWTPGGSAVEICEIGSLAGQIAAASLPAIGSWLQTGCYVKCSGGPGIRGVTKYNRQQPSTPANLLAHSLKQLTGYPLTTDAWEGWAMPPPFQLRASMTTMWDFFQMQIDNAAASGTYTFEFAAPFIVQISDPTF